MDLPPEMLSEIFQYLNTSDRAEAGLVCKSWLDAASHPTYFKKIKVLVSDQNAIDVFANATRKFLDFSLACDCNTRKFKTMLEAIRGNITHISIIAGCEITSNLLIRILNTSPKLTHLEISMEYVALRNWRYTDFKNLTTNLQHFHCWTSFENNMFNAIINCMPKLESISFGGSTDDFGSRLFSISWRNKIKSLMSQQSFEDFLIKFGPQLKSLEIHRIGLWQLRSLINILVHSKAQINLENLSLYVLQSDTEQLNQFLNTQTKLKRLILADTCLRDETLETVSNLKLSCLFLKNCNFSSVTDAGGAVLKNIPVFKELKLTNLFSITSLGFSNGMNFDHLDTLCINDVRAFTLHAFERIVKQLAQLRHLEVEACPSLLCNDFIQLICRFLIKLKQLKLSGPGEISDDAFIRKDLGSVDYPIRRLQELDKLELKFMSKLTDDCMKAFAFRSLRYFRLYKCEKITSSGVKSVILNCPALENISIHVSWNKVDEFQEIQRFAALHLKRFKKVNQ